MKLYVAGGCGEHGRNCFLVQDESISFLVDCGIKAGESEDKYPHLTQEQINTLDVVFLTHCHNDHVGAVGWLIEHGYQGPFITTKKTVMHIPFVLPDVLYLETICPSGTGNYKDLHIEWGRSGHCDGSVWYKITHLQKTILFSGDYFEEGQVYNCDLLRNKIANLAVIDCAYGNQRKTYQDYCKYLIAKTKLLLDEHKLLLFPVPKQGRGLELRKLLGGALVRTNFFGDNTFINNLNDMFKDKYWYKEVDNNSLQTLLYENQKEGIVFVSDAQLKSIEARTIVNIALTKGAICVMSGTVEEGTYSEQLIKQGQMILLRYPVHQNIMQYEKIVEQNHFDKVIPFHTVEYTVESPLIF